ncbi:MULTISPECIES: hypothetical protein [Enterobacterales]|uniref:hypothetical protein n=1 Tax=Enterobacterales TaxID=91347 RepID=UPI002ED7840F
MLMTKAAYARHKGVSRQTVYDRIARGELVLVGGKIDASASERKATGFVTPDAWRDDSKRVNISPKAALFSQNSDYSEEKNQVIPVSPDEAAAIVLALDDVYPPATDYEELQTRILDAVEALGLEVITLDIEGDEEHISGIAVYDPEQCREVMRFESFLFELEALTFLRWLVVSKRLTDSYLNNATKIGLAALAEPFITSAQDIYSERFDFDEDA